MTRYFAALPLPDDVSDHLTDHLAALPAAFPPGTRRVDRDQWHITLAYYGKDDPETRLPWLAERARGHPAPCLRLRGSGRFSDVAWIGVDGDLNDLAAAVAARKECRAYVPHVTIARGLREWTPDLPDYQGREWIAPELVLYSSEQGRYTRVGVVRLALTPTC